MDPIARAPRTDLHAQPTAPRQTPRAGADFRDMLARSAASIVQGAQSAATRMPGGPVLAAAVRGAGGPSRPGAPAPSPALAPSPLGGGLAAPSAPTNPLAPPPPAVGGAAGSAVAAVPAEGPGATDASPQGAGGSVEGALQASAEQNLYYLQLQEAMSAENRVYSAQSNVLKARHDTVKNAIGNIR